VVAGIRFRSVVVCVASFLVPTLAATASAQLRAEIVGPGMMRVPIALAPLAPQSALDTPLEREFSRVLAGDLEISGLFRVLDPASFIETVPEGPLGPERVNFLNWQAVGARGLLLGRYERVGAELVVEVAFFDVPGRAMLGGRRFRGRENEVARMAHRAADMILEFTTGTAGPFDSRIAFVSNRGGHAKEIHTFTFDGAITKVTSHRTVTMAPAWSPDLSSILFTSFRGGRPTLYSRRIASGEETVLAAKMGLNVGGAWRPNGSQVAVAREEAGNTDIYLLDFAGQKQERLTEHWGIDVDPSWSPDGTRLAFCSSRGGTPQVYVLTLADREAKRVTFSGNYNCSPSWSPDGRLLAYAGRVGREFHIFAIPAAGGEARQLTFTGSNEDPSWAPDSRFIVFSRELRGGKKLFLVDVTGRWERQLTTGNGDDTSPTWSGRIE
jgi:TolB protein